MKGVDRMIVILEGPDGCFKSTLAEGLKTKFGFEYIHGSDFESAKGSNEKLFQFYKDVLEKLRGKDVAVDRYYLSNLVYATLYPGYSKLTDDQVTYLEDELNKENVVTLFMYDSPTNIFKRILDRGDDKIKTRDEIQKILDCYSAHIIGRNMDFKFYDCSVFDPEEFEEHIKERKERDGSPKLD